MTYDREEAMRQQEATEAKAVLAAYKGVKGIVMITGEQGDE